jgi:hypothetical protein
MKITCVALSVLSLVSISDAVRDAKRFRSKKNAVCFLGCTPYVDPVNGEKGLNKYKALVDDMTDNCDLILHLGDTKAGSAVCNSTIMTGPLHIIADSAKAKGVAFMYTPGDNELNDCHRDGSRVPSRAAEYYKAEEARKFLLSDMGMDANPEKDVTGVFAVEAHYKNGTVPGTSKPYSCDFDKLIMTKDAVIATIEMPGSAVRNMYLTFSLLGQSFTPLFCNIFP